MAEPEPSSELTLTEPSTETPTEPGAESSVASSPDSSVESSIEPSFGPSTAEDPDAGSSAPESAVPEPPTPERSTAEAPTEPPVVEPVPGPDGPVRGPRVLLLRLCVIVVVLVLGVGGTWLVQRLARQPAGPAPDGPPVLRLEPADVEPGSEAPVPGQAARPDTGKDSEREDEPRSGTGVGTLAEWADTVAPRVGIPARALRAYGNAELVVREQLPECHLSWTTLAGIGRIESDHGRHGGAVLREDGRPSIPIIGIALDGGPGVKAIPDTDGGALDGDSTYDRAVGPMQFIPGTWKRHGVDASGDGIADPQQIDDAALSAGLYLCRGGRDLSAGEGWWAGVLSYNNSVDYGRTVFALAEQYAELAADNTE